MRHYLLLFCASVAPMMCLAQAKRESIEPMMGFHYGVPLKWSLGFAVPLPGGTPQRNGFVAAEPGIGGARASIGYLFITGDLGSGYVLRASLLRTGGRAWRAPLYTTFAGAEFQYMPLFVLGVRVGAFARLSRGAGRKGMFTADVSLML